MYIRKFNKYQVIVEFLNGEVEVFSELSSYSQSLNKYNEAKKKFKKYTCKVRFLGINDRETKELYCKNIITEDLKIHEQMLSIANNDLETLLLEAKELNKRIEDRCNHVNSMVGKVDKEENIELHKIELLSSNENETIDDVEEKLKILNNIQRIRADRRSLKNESYYISKFKKQDDELINIGLINYILGEINSSKNNHKNCGSMKKFKYKGFKERMRLVRDLEKRYDRVVINEKKMEICCYNNIGCKR